MDRRRFLQTAGVGVAVGLIAPGCGAGGGYDADVLVRPVLLAALGAGRVRDIGTAYRAMTPPERDARSLRAAIDDSRPSFSRRPGARPSSLDDLVRDDFRSGRTVVVRGWILSLTEARQCALFSLGPA